MKYLGPAALTAYALAIAAANITTDHLGMVPVGFGLTATAGTYAAGLALLLRDAVHELYGWRWVLAGIATGALLTAVTAPQLAFASAAAFLAAELMDWGVYSKLRNRGLAVAAFASGCAGALVDTLLFLWLSPFPITPEGVGGQLVGKVVWATVLPVLAFLTVRQVRRAVPRHSLGA